MRALGGQTGDNRRTAPNEHEDLGVSRRNRHVDDAACRRRGRWRSGSEQRIEATRSDERIGTEAQGCGKE
jgi:hypothetical protein